MFKKQKEEVKEFVNDFKVVPVAFLLSASLVAGFACGVFCASIVFKVANS